MIIASCILLHTAKARLQASRVIDKGRQLANCRADSVDIFQEHAADITARVGVKLYLSGALRSTWYIEYQCSQERVTRVGHKRESWNTTTMQITTHRYSTHDAGTDLLMDEIEGRGGAQREHDDGKGEPRRTHGRAHRAGTRDINC